MPKEIKGPDRRSEEEKYAALVPQRFEALKDVTGLVCDLLDAGFRGIWIETTQAGNDYFHCRVIIDSDEISPTRFETLANVADIHDAKIHLEEVRMNQQSFSRVALWLARHS